MTTPAELREMGLEKTADFDTVTAHIATKTGHSGPVRTAVFRAREMRDELLARINAQKDELEDKDYEGLLREWAAEKQRAGEAEAERDQARKDEAEELHRRVIAEAKLAALTAELVELVDCAELMAMLRLAARNLYMTGEATEEYIAGLRKCVKEAKP